MRKHLNDSAVSPTISMLLLLVLCVALTAVVIALVMNMGNTAPAIRMVSFTAHQEGETIYVTYHGGPNQLDVADPGIVALVNEQEMQTPFTKSGHVEVGTSAKTMGTLGKDHVVVTVTFKDGRKEIVLNTWV